MTKAERAILSSIIGEIQKSDDKIDILERLYFTVKEIKGGIVMKARIINTEKIIDVKKIADGRYVSKSNTHIFGYDELDFDDLEVQKNKTVNKIREVIKEYFSNYNAGKNIEKQYAISDFCEEVDDLLRRLKL